VVESNQLDNLLFVAMSVVCDVSELEYLTEQRLNDVIESCRQSGVWAKLVHVIGSVFIDPEALMYSFISNSSSDNALLSKKCEEVMLVDDNKEPEVMVSLRRFHSNTLC